MINRRASGHQDHLITMSQKSRLLLISLIAILLAILGFVSTAWAQNLSFSVPELRMQVFVQPDASARIIYDIKYSNNSFGDPIDIIDIGMPHSDYDLANMSATMNGFELLDFRPSEYVDPGVEIHLHDQTIPPGAEGTLHMEFAIPDLVYQDQTDKTYASMQITPTWFDPASVTGTSDIWILVHLLPDIHPDEVLYQDVPFTDKAIYEEHTVVGWRFPEGNASIINRVGVSFPTRGMSRVIEQSFLELLEKWLLDNSEIRVIFGSLSLILFAITFFRFTWGTGISVFVMLAIGIGFILVSIPISVLLAFPISAVLFSLNEWRIRNRKSHYLPAIAQVEGGGIKRGLTAPEAAILLELPLNKVLTLIIFGLLEKGVIDQVEHSPLQVEIAPEFSLMGLARKQRRARRLEIAQRLGIVIRTYEHPFLDLLEEQKGKPAQDINFSEPVKSLIQHTADRMKGFDLSDSQDYYRKIIARAMKEAQDIGDIAEKERYLDRHMQWLLLDDGYPTVFTTRGYHYRPIWIRPFSSSDRLGIPTSPTGTPSVGGRTTFGDVAASFAGWTENTMGNLASTILPGSLSVDGPMGAVNLSGADKVTGDIFKALMTSSGSGGSRGSSGGGGCACACAGCACACACAGGGR